MRPDMDKVIVERPRFGSRQHGTPKGLRRRLQRFGDDGPPRFEGIKRRGGKTKYLNEHLGPLRRYLDSQVGRPWDLVFSEICAQIDRKSAVQDHVRDHVEGYVARHVVEVDGVLHVAADRWRGGGPLADVWSYRWYVCPRTGLLRRKPPRPRPPARPDRPEPPRYVRVSETSQCRKVDGVWHLVELGPLPPPWSPSAARDVLLDRPAVEVSPEKARQEYGDAVYAVSTRRLSRRELKQSPVPMDEWN